VALYGVKFKKLAEFTTTRKDLKKGVKRIPLELARLNKEDPSQTSISDLSKQLEEKAKLEIKQEFDSNFDDYASLMQERSTAYAKTSIVSKSLEEEWNGKLLEGS